MFDDTLQQEDLAEDGMCDVFHCVFVFAGLSLFRLPPYALKFIEMCLIITADHGPGEKCGNCEFWCDILMFNVHSTLAFSAASHVKSLMFRSWDFSPFAVEWHCCSACFFGKWKYYTLKHVVYESPEPGYSIYRVLCQSRLYRIEWLYTCY